jgi:hypothetical protein
LLDGMAGVLQHPLDTPLYERARLAAPAPADEDIPRTRSARS